jgi:hypothetical protein
MVLDIFVELNKKDIESLSAKIRPHRLSKISNTIPHSAFRLSMLYCKNNP